MQLVPQHMQHAAKLENAGWFLPTFRQITESGSAIKVTWSIVNKKCGKFIHIELINFINGHSRGIKNVDTRKKNAIRLFFFIITGL